MRVAFIALVVGMLLTTDAFGLSIQLVKTSIEEPLQADGMVRVIPEIVNLGSGGVIGQYFTVAVVIEDVADLYGFEIRFRWNTTYLNFASHLLTIPVEDYPTPQTPSPYGGILHAPRLVVKDEVNTTAGTYWGAFATLGGSGFTGNGTAFLMTFRVKEQFNTDVWVVMNITYADLGGGPIGPFPIIQDGLVRIPGIFREIAITNVTASRTLVSHGYNIIVNVTVTNRGEIKESFRLVTYWNSATVSGIWGSVRGASLQVNETKTFTIIRNASQPKYHNYSMWAQAGPLLGESNTADNKFTDGWVCITTPGDMDFDFDVDIYDLLTIVDVYGENIPLTWPILPQDIDGDGDVDIYDVVIAASHYGESW